MKHLIIFMSIFVYGYSFAADPVSDCENMVSLRNRTVGVSAALSKIELGGKVNIKENADLTAHLLTLISFDSYICRLNEILPGDEKIKEADRIAWIDEINNAFRALNEAAAGQGAKEITVSLNSKIAEIEKMWILNGEKRKRYEITLKKDYSKDFLKNTKEFSTASTSGTIYVKGLVNQISLNGEFDSKIAEGENVVGNLLYLLKEMRANVGTFASGKQSAGVMLSQLVKRIEFVASQLADKKATEMKPEEFAQTLAFNGTPLVKDLQKKLSDLRAEVDALKSAAAK